MENNKIMDELKYVVGMAVTDIKQGLRNLHVREIGTGNEGREYIFATYNGRTIELRVRNSGQTDLGKLLCKFRLDFMTAYDIVDCVRMVICNHE